MTNSFWSPEGDYWGPIVKDDNGTNVDYNCVPPFSCVPSSEEMKVFAVDDGVVGNIDYLGDKVGWKVEILHSDGIVGNYGHIADPHKFVQVGQRVGGEQQIADLSPTWDYFLAFQIFRYTQRGTDFDYNPLDFGLPIP